MGKFVTNVSGAAIEESMENGKNRENNEEKKPEFDAKNYLDTKLENGVDERSITIRILPVSCDNGDFKIAVKTHSLKVNKRIANSGFKSFLCLDDPQVPNYDPNVQCPICAKVNYYFEEARKCRESDPVKSKELYKKACSMRNKTTYIVRVIERGKENEGVKFWRFNENTQHKGAYDMLMTLYKQRKKDMEETGDFNYNIFDLDNGRDIVINLTRTERADGQEGVTMQITDKSVNKPLTNDIELGNSWINDVKKWYDAYAVKSAEYLTIVANDMIPYKDKATGKIIPKTEQDFLDYEKKKLEEKAANESAANEARKEYAQENRANYQVPTQPKPMPQIVVNEDNGDDLPF